MAITSKKGQEALKGSSKLNTLPGYTEPKVPAVNPYAHTHTDTDKENRSKRVYFLIKPSANQRLDAMVKRGEIISKNDLVNKLIDQFLLENDTVGEAPSIRPDGQYKGQMSIDDIDG